MISLYRKWSEQNRERSEPCTSSTKRSFFSPTCIHVSFLSVCVCVCVYCAPCLIQYPEVNYIYREEMELQKTGTRFSWVIQQITCGARRTESQIQNETQWEDLCRDFLQFSKVGKDVQERLLHDFTHRKVEFVDCRSSLGFEPFKVMRGRSKYETHMYHGEETPVIINSICYPPFTAKARPWTAPSYVFILFYLFVFVSFFPGAKRHKL